MKGAVQIAKFANIPVFVHWSFGLIIMFVIGNAINIGSDIQLVIFYLCLILAVYVCIVMHEYGHALTAKRYGVNTKDIILFPIGGVARLERLPEKPMEEFYIAIAGPMVNIAIAIGLTPYFLISKYSPTELLNESYLTEPSLFQIFIPIIILTNIGLAIFNLTPAFPMDGGRVLRSLLSIKIGRLKATRIASILGQICAVGFFIFGIWNFNLIHILIGMFIFYTASVEYNSVKVDNALSQQEVKDILRTSFTTIDDNSTMQVASDELKKGIEEFILEAIRKKDFDAPVINYTSPNYEGVSPNENLKSIFHKMQTKGYSILPVYENGILVGVVDVTMLNNFLKVQQKIGA